MACAGAGRGSSRKNSVIQHLCCAAVSGDGMPVLRALYESLKDTFEESEADGKRKPKRARVVSASQPPPLPPPPPPLPPLPEVDPKRISVRGPPFPPGTVHVFVDYSNIVLGAPVVSDNRVYNPDGKRVAIRDHELAACVEAERVVGKRVVGGSWPSETSPVWLPWRNLGYDVHLASSGGEVFVDDMIVGQFNQLVVDVLNPQGQTIVLLTGDGNDNGGRASFKSATEGALRRGWNVELWSWRRSCSGAYRQILERSRRGEFAGRLTVQYLDSVLTFVTFVT